MTAAPLASPRRLTRNPSRQVVGGVASGLALHLAVPVWAVRLAFVVAAFVSGLGVAVYLGLWLLTPMAELRRRSIPARLLTVAGGVLLVSSLLWSIGHDMGRLILGASVLTLVVGGALVWRSADAQAQQRLVARLPKFLTAGMSESPAWLGWALPVATGGAMIAIGLVGILAVSGELTAARQGVLFSVVTLLGVAIAAGPWLLRYANELRMERSERIRSQERAEIAAIVHDKVLHTLALIQRASDDSREVARLARGQERELRNWLYKPTHSPSERFAAAIEAAAAEVEDTFAVRVSVVVVGDTAMSETVAALVAAAREALVNAAKHAGESEISLYGEVSDSEAEVFVRDRGAGFDPEQIADDRHGVRGSIVERMRRHGGSAAIKTQPGEGTEVRLRAPLSGKGEEDR